MVALEAPGVKRNRNVIDQGIVAGEIKVDQAGKLIAQEENIVGKEIGMDHARGQVGRPMAGEMLEFLLDGGAQTWRNLIGMLLEAGVKRMPARRPKRIGAAEGKILTGEMHARHGLADGGAMHHLWAADPDALKKCDQGGRPAGKPPQALTLGIANRRRAADPGVGEVLHQAEEKRQILGGHPLFVEGKEKGTRFGVEQVVGVLNTLGDALEGKQRANLVAGDEPGELLVGDFSVDSHSPWPCFRRYAAPTSRNSRGMEKPIRS